MLPVVVDFETHPIEPRPNYPPKPVGVSIMYPGEKPKYYAFGHPTENNCTEREAEAALAKAWQWKAGLLFHNGKFDLDVAETHFPVLAPNRPAPELVHDTMFQVFLQDPHAESHGLKQSAERLLGMPPEERDEVRDWLIKEGVVTKASKNWGAFIWRAPGGLVGKYANGDVIRTAKLFKKLTPELRRRKMLAAYRREQELMPILLGMERRGVPVSVTALAHDVTLYKRELATIDAWIYRKLKVKQVNLNSEGELVEALIAAKLVNTDALGKTPTGAWKTDKESLGKGITDSVLAAMLNHRASLQTCLGTFMEPWLETAKKSGGLIFTGWNQLKQYHGNATKGAVTGRMSSSPNFQNIPKEFKPVWKHEQPDKKKAKLLPTCPLKLNPLPLVRSYVVAPPGYTLIDRDYSQQELRILAHFEDGDLQAAYNEHPWMDVHDTVGSNVNSMLGTAFERPVVKQINFGLIYGMGVALMAKKAGCSDDEARAAKKAVLDIYPGLRELQNGLKELARNGQALRTWGGRQYFVEPPKVRPDLSVWTFEYKMLNVLVQGSAADCTKEAMIRYHRAKPENHHMLIQVHDELLCMVPTNEVALGMEILRKTMESVSFSVPMLSDGKTSTTTWADMKPYDKEGVIL